MVIGKPSPPQCPKVTEIFEDNCTLNWQEPKDDGGTPLLNYKIEMMNLEDRRWNEVGETPDLNFKVNGLKKNGKYKFRIRATNKIGPSEPAEIPDTVVAKNPWGKGIV